jgi:hypothetical protein
VTFAFDEFGSIKFFDSSKKKKNREEGARKLGRCRNDNVGHVLRENEESGILKRKERGIFGLLG